MLWLFRPNFFTEVRLYTQRIRVNFLSSVHCVQATLRSDCRALCIANSYLDSIIFSVWNCTLYSYITDSMPNSLMNIFSHSCTSKKLLEHLTVFISLNQYKRNLNLMSLSDYSKARREDIDTLKFWYHRA